MGYKGVIYGAALAIKNIVNLLVCYVLKRYDYQYY